MQFFGLLIASVLGYGIKELAIRALAAIGFGLVTTYGMYSLFDQVQVRFQAQLSGLPADILTMLGIMQVDNCFTMILSAAAAKQLMLGWSKLTNSRTGRVWRSPGSSNGTPF